MDALIISQNQRENLKICVETLYQFGNIDNISMVIIDEDCRILDLTSSEESNPKVVVYMPPLNTKLSMVHIVGLLKSVCEMLEFDIIIKMLLPIALAGEEPLYAYEIIYREVYRNGFVLQEVNPTLYYINENKVVGYEFTISLRKKKSILFLKSGNALLDYNANQIAEAYRHLGWEIVIGDLRTDSIPGLLQTGVTKVFVLNNMGWVSAQTSSGDIVWDEYKIPSINYIYDHPMYFDEILKVAPKEGILVCVDNNHTRYIRRFYPNINVCHFMPLAGDNDLDGIARNWDDREIEVLYVGGYKGSLDFSRFTNSKKCMLEAILQNMNMPTEVTIEEQYRNGCDCSENGLKEEIIRYKELDWYIMTYIRVEVIRVLVRGGVDVTVYGYGWEQFEYFDNPHFIYGGKITQAECLEQMKNSKIVLNVMPWFKDGMHDRVINAMLAGAVALSDGSVCLDENFEAGKDYVAYDIRHLERLPELVRGVLDKDNVEMRNRAYLKAKERHRWIQRVEELEEQLERAKQ